MSIAPPSARTRVYTASTPTPRPEISVTFSAVENPGRASNRKSSSSVKSVLLASTIPSRLARASTRSRSIPLPSSLTLITTAERSRAALSTSRPIAGLPAAARASGDSMPWSIALRSRCTIGSPISSSIERSSSISLPSILNSTSLPSARAVSRTTRGKRSNTCHTGTIRLAVISLRSSVINRDDCVTVSSSDAWPSSPASCVSRPRAITSSPMRFISVSSRRASMRTRSRRDRPRAPPTPPPTHGTHRRARRGTDTVGDARTARPGTETHEPPTSSGFGTARPRRASSRPGRGMHERL